VNFQPDKPPRYDLQGLEETIHKTWMGIGESVLSFVLAGTAIAGADGANVYKQCSFCHKSDEGGSSGFYLPLAGNAPKILGADRTYMVEAVLYGLEGKIEGGGKTYQSKMPAFGGRLNDDEIAAVLNYVLANWGNDKMLPKEYEEFTTADVNALRGKMFTAWQVHEERQKLNLK
jgi:mono/diheme cytochrome c family protein